MAPRFSASGSFAGVYGISDTVVSVINETANYSGAVMIFQQTSAPTGWTKSTTDDDAILTATTGSLTTGGTLAFSSTLNSPVSITGKLTFGSMTIGSTTVTAGMIPLHTHPFTGYTVYPFRAVTPGGTATVTTNATSPVAGSPVFTAPYTGPSGHTHPQPSAGLSSLDTTYYSSSFSLKYVDVIVATKD
jgi:hypothetical protein